MEQDLRSLLDKIYELEGLVHLALKRDVSSEDFIRLISKKGKEVGEMATSLNADSPIEEESHNESPAFSFDEYTIEETPEPLFTKIYDTDKPAIETDSTSLVNEPVYPKGKLVFSINEKFRFRKELFDNSDADFNNTLALVASMESFEEAEDYFINEEGFDPSNPVVTEFMNVIKRYFK